MPTEQGESVTDDLEDPPTPTASHFPEPPEEVIPSQTRPEEETPEHPQQEDEACQSQAGHQSHVIKNVDEIFHTIEGLMSKLRQLKVRMAGGAIMNILPGLCWVIIVQGPIP